LKFEFLVKKSSEFSKKKINKKSENQQKTEETSEEP
jgi:hypothetical protein